jgi:hypothetical protein
MALILDGNGLIQGLDAGGLPSGSVNADTLASTLDLSSKTMTFGNVSASGITFPASASASSNANTLDDYEEGTFTPVLQRDSTTMTVGLAEGFYTKIGRQVFIQLQVQDITDAGTTEALKFTGLPFAGSSSFDRQQGTLIFNRITKPANAIDSAAIIPGFQSAYTTLALYWNQTGDVNFLAWTPNDLASATDSDIAAAITYFVD